MLYFKNSKQNHEIIAKGMEFPIDHRNMFPSNREMLAFVENQIDDTVKIKNIYFATFPISILGTVVVIVKLDTNDMVFATIQNVDYYEDMDFRKVYAYQEMMQYLNTFSVTA